MNISSVLAWARVWNVPFFRDTIPYLAWTEVAEKADIRVMFSRKLSVSVSEMYLKCKSTCVQGREGTGLWWVLMPTLSLIRASRPWC